MGALALHKQEVGGDEGQVHGVHDGRRVALRRQGSTDRGRPAARVGRDTVSAVLRRFLRNAAIAAAVVVAVALVARALVSRLRPAPEPAVSWPPLSPEPGEAEPVQAEPVQAKAVERAEPTAPPESEPEPAAKSEPEPAVDASPWVEPEGDACPASHPLKAKLGSGIFHAPGGLNYDRTKPDRCYADAAAAEADGLRPSKR
jgi:hypothetical protein